MAIWLLSALALVAGAGVAGCEGDDEDAGGEAAATASAGVEPGSISFGDLHSCGNRPEPPGFRCGELEVPYERADPSLGTLEIGFAVRPRDDRKQPSKGAIFAVEGGPGYSSTGTANAFTKLFGGLLRERELVLVDMRGTGRSEPLNCPDVQRGTAPEWLALSQCARKLGPRYASYRTQAATDDIDAVLQALGLDQITLYGDSYGTYLAQAYAFRHPETLNALVLDSAYPARGESPWYPSLPRTGIRAMSLACERAPSCPGDAGVRLARLAEELRKTRRGVGDLIDKISEAAYGAPATYRQIDRAGRALLAGDEAAWREFTAPAKPGFRFRREYVRAGELVVGCNDYPMIWDKEASEPERRAQLEEAIRTTDPKPYEPFTPREIALSSEFGYLECLTWPPPGEHYEPPIPPGANPTEAPVLVLSGELDDVTTPHEGQVVAAEFPNSKYREVRGAGHVDALYYANGRAATAVRRFLRRELG